MRNVDRVFAYKHNGSFHRAYLDIELLNETRDYFVLYNKTSNQVYEKKNYKWYTKEDAIFYFSKEHWFNIIVMLKDTGIVYYCNIATPPLYEHNSIKYIDYDLDVKYFPNTKEIKLLDENEYAYNKRKFKYPEEVLNKIDDELKILKKWIKHEVGPFSKEFVEKYKR